MPALVSIISHQKRTLISKCTILACSELSSDVPGLATHFLKHLSDIFWNQKHADNIINYLNLKPSVRLKLWVNLRLNYPDKLYDVIIKWTSKSPIMINNVQN